MRDCWERFGKERAARKTQAETIIRREDEPSGKIAVTGKGSRSKEPVAGVGSQACPEVIDAPTEPTIDERNTSGGAGVGNGEEEGEYKGEEIRGPRTEN